MRHVLLVALVLLIPACAKQGTSSAEHQRREIKIDIPDIRGLVNPPAAPGRPVCLPPIQVQPADQSNSQPVPAHIHIVESSGRSEAMTPDNPTKPAASHADLDGAGGDSGAQQERDLAREQQVRTITWAGIGIFSLGVLSIVVRFWLPIIPISASITAIVAGIALLWLPDLFKQHSWLMIGAVALVGVLYAVGGIDNIVKLRGNR